MVIYLSPGTTLESQVGALAQWEAAYFQNPTFQNFRSIEYTKARIEAIEEGRAGAIYGDFTSRDEWDTMVGIERVPAGYQNEGEIMSRDEPSGSTEGQAWTKWLPLLALLPLLRRR